MSRTSNFMLAAFLPLAISCSPAIASFDAARCKLEVGTRLGYALREQGWRLSDNLSPSPKLPFLALRFSREGADIDLLHQFMSLRGYFAVAGDPSVPARSRPLIFNPARAARNLSIQQQVQSVKELACDANHLSGARLEAVFFNLGTDVPLTVEFK